MGGVRREKIGGFRWGRGGEDEEREIEKLNLERCGNILGILILGFCDGDRSVITGYRLTASTKQWVLDLGSTVGPLDPRLCPIFLGES